MRLPRPSLSVANIRLFHLICPLIATNVAPSNNPVVLRGYASLLTCLGKGLIKASSRGSRIEVETNKKGQRRWVYHTQTKNDQPFQIGLPNVSWTHREMSRVRQMRELNNLRCLSPLRPFSALRPFHLSLRPSHLYVMLTVTIRPAKIAHPLLRKWGSQYPFWGNFIHILNGSGAAITHEENAMRASNSLTHDDAKNWLNNLRPSSDG